MSVSSTDSLPPTERDALLQRFLRYVRIDTQSDPQSDLAPSTAKQLDLSRLLAAECEAMGLENVTQSEHGPVWATLPASDGSENSPRIVLCSHVDTSPENSGTSVQPQVIENYDGGEIVLPGDPRQVIRPSEHPDLAGVTGHTLITSDGTTLLGGDDKTGLAVIMAAVEKLKTDGLPHGPITVLFTVDEEIGRGAHNLDLGQFGAVAGYTLDSDGAGKLNAETFSADGATVTVHGVNIHPSIGKGRLVNAIKLLSRYVETLPSELIGPEDSEGRQGFVHPTGISGSVETAHCEFILRSFDTSVLAEQADALRAHAKTIEAAEPRCRIEVETHQQYRNMADGFDAEPRAVPLARQAIENMGLTPEEEPIRGGTDGSLFTAMGLPTPNLSSGQHTAHSLQEWASLDEMAQAVTVVVELARLWSEQT